MITRLAICVAVFACTSLSGCATKALSSDVKPKLVVVLVVDGLAMRQVTSYRDQLGADGLLRFLERGTWFSQAYFGHAYTVTAAGHASMLTGASPWRSGIIGNEWRDPATGEAVYCTGDDAHTYLGHKTARLSGTSPKNLRAESLGDVLKRVDPKSKVVAISGKDRGAILPAGKRGTAYMYMSDTGSFASTTYYMKEHPKWVTDHNVAKPADKYFKRHWTPLLAEDAYEKSVADGQRWYSNAGDGKLPMTLGSGDAPDAAFYGTLLASPFHDELTLDFARAAIAGESLGMDDSPDILAISLSSHDYVNHAWSAESRLSHDHTLWLDRALEAFFKDLDERVGKDNYIAMLTADHGFMPAPEHTQSLGKDAGRIDSSKMAARVNAELAKQFGAGRWLLGFSANGALLNKALIAERKVDAGQLAREARTALAGEPGIAAAYLKADIEAGKLPAGTPYAAALAKSVHTELSPEIILVLKPNWMRSSRAAGTTHGSPYEYDSHVPILFYGPRFAPTGRVDTLVEVVDIAPTLAQLLGIPAPAQSEGKPLPLLRRNR